VAEIRVQKAIVPRLIRVNDHRSIGAKIGGSGSLLRLPTEVSEADVETDREEEVFPGRAPDPHVCQ
jgi:hypothetical protein